MARLCRLLAEAESTISLATPALTSPAEDMVWTDMMVTSPVTVPIVFTENRFFRLICP